MTEFISTMPLLVLFNITWIVSFAAVFFVKKEYRIPLLLIAIISSILIINFSTVDVRCIQCTGVEMSMSNMGVFPVQELLIIHSFGFIPIQLALLIYFALTGSFAALKESLKGRE